MASEASDKGSRLIRWRVAVGQRFPVFHLWCGWDVKSEAVRFFLGAFNITQRVADSVTLLQLGGPLNQSPRTRGGDAHGRLLGLDLQQVLIHGNFLTCLKVERYNGGLCYGLAQLGHDDWNAWHNEK